MSSPILLHNELKSGSLNFVARTSGHVIRVEVTPPPNPAELLYMLKGLQAMSHEITHPKDVLGHEEMGWCEDDDA